MPTEVKKTVGATGRDFSTWESYVDQIAVDPIGDDENHVGEGHDDAEFSVTSGDGMLFDTARTTDATRDIDITVAAGKSFVDKITPNTDALKYSSTGKGVALRVHTTSFTGRTIHFTADNNFTKIRRLMLKNTVTRRVINSASGEMDDSLFEQLICEQTKDNTVIQNSGSADVVWRNILVIQNNSTTTNEAIELGFSNTNVLDFITIVRPDDITAGGEAIGTSRTNVILRNCAIFGFTTPADGTWDSNSNFNATDQASGVPGASTKFNVGYTQTTPFEDSFAASQDWTPKSGTDLDNNGTDVPAITVDILDQIREDPPSIGCFEIPPRFTYRATFRGVGKGNLIGI